MPTWKNDKHGAQWINTLRDYAFAKIGRMPVDSIGQPEVLMCLSPFWTEKHETARRLAQRIKTVLDVAKSKGFRSGENPVTSIHDAQVLPKMKAKPKHHIAMTSKDVPAFYADLKTRDAMAAKALMFTCLTGSRTGEVLGTKLSEIDPEARLWTCPAERMKGGVVHRVPLSDEMLAIIEPLRAMQSAYVFEGQKLFCDLLEFEQDSRAPRDPAIIQAVTGVAGAEVEIAYVRNGTTSVELLCYSAPLTRADLRPRPFGVAAHGDERDRHGRHAVLGPGRWNRWVM